MIRSIILLCFLLVGTANAQNIDPLVDPNENINPSETMEQAMEEMSQFFDTLNINEIFGNRNMDELFNGLGIEKENIEGIHGLMDSMGFSEMLGQDFSKLFEGGGFPDASEMDIQQLDKMMEQSIEMFKDIDISQMQKMMEGIDMSEMMKMFEGFDMEQFHELIPKQPAEKSGDESGKKKLKKL